MAIWRNTWTTRLLLGCVAVALLPTMAFPQGRAVPAIQSQEAIADPVLVSPTPSVYCLEQLAHLSQQELEQLYRGAEAGVIPAGYLHGKALYCPTEPFAGAKSRVADLLWQGKRFDPCSGTLVNQWRGFQAIRARVDYGTSWLDGGLAIIMDYQGLSRVWAKVRDEMRQVGPELYLGIMYVRRCPDPKRKQFFALEVQALEACPAWPSEGTPGCP